MRAFARDMVARKVIASNRLHAILAAGPLYSKLALTDDNALDRSVHHGEERITTAYLLSSDFFLNGTDATLRSSLPGLLRSDSSVQQSLRPHRQRIESRGGGSAACSSSQNRKSKSHPAHADTGR